MKFIRLINFTKEGNNIGGAIGIPTTAQNRIENEAANKNNVSKQDVKTESRSTNPIITQRVNDDGSIERSLESSGGTFTFKWNPEIPDDLREEYETDNTIYWKNVKRGYLFDPNKKSHGEIEGVYDQNQINTAIESPSIVKDAVKRGGFKIPHDVMKKIMIPADKDGKTRALDFYSYFKHLADQYNKDNGTEFDGDSFRNSYFSMLKQKRMEANIEDLKSQGASEEQINTYKEWFSKDPNILPLWVDRTKGHVEPYGLNFFMHSNGVPLRSVRLDPIYYEKVLGERDTNNAGYAKMTEILPYSDGSRYKVYDGLIYLKDYEGNDTSGISGPHEIAHVYTIPNEVDQPPKQSKAYENYLKKAKVISKNVLDAYGSSPAEKSRMWAESKTKLLMNGDVKLEDVHNFKIVAPRLLQYFDEFDRNPEFVEALMSKVEYRPLIQSYYIFKNLYKGDRNAWYKGEFKNYETAKNGHNAWQQNRNGGWLNTTPRTGLQRLAMGSYGVPA